MLPGLNLNRILAFLVGVLVILGVAIFAVRMYGNSRVVAQELSNTQEAVQEAVQRRDERVQRDVSTKAERASTGRQTRSVVKRTEDSLASLKPESRTGVLLSPDERGVWNDLIRDANRSITAP
jgi:hypothetical protein